MASLVMADMEAAGEVKEAEDTGVRFSVLLN